MTSLRAVLYARCSTEEESQIDALRNQAAEARSCIAMQGWLQVGEYIESKSGTTTKGRTEYNRLYEDLLSDQFDIIVIKSQDRLMRNVKDWYLFLDRMITHNKKLFIYIEQKFYTTDDALITGIKAILAEEYSRELSKKITNAHRYRQQHGGKIMMTNQTFGFEKQPDGSMKVLEKEGEILHKIYEYCAAGYGSRSISNFLRKNGVLSKNGKELSPAQVRRMIRNPIYKGIVVMNKQHFDFETKKVIHNPPEEWIYREGMIPAIIDEKLWDAANIAMDNRAERFHQNGRYVKGKNPGRYVLSGKLVCGDCGAPYYRTWRKGSDSSKVIYEWKCSNYINWGRKKQGCRVKTRKVTDPSERRGCDNIHLDEETVFSVLEQFSSCYYLKQGEKEMIINQMIHLLEETLEQDDLNKQMNELQSGENEIRKKKDLLLNKLLEGIVSDEDYRIKIEELKDSMEKIQNKIRQLQSQKQEQHAVEHRLRQIRVRLEQGGVEKATASRMLDDISSIIVHEWQLEIQFSPVLMTGIPEAELKIRNVGFADREGVVSVFVDYPFTPETERGRHQDRKRILKLLREEPGTTVKKMAEKMNRPYGTLQARMRELKGNGYVRFCGKGGRGTWEVLKELNDENWQMHMK